jgi:hypothetical protein
MFGALDNILVDFKLGFGQNLHFMLPLACFVILMFGFLLLSMQVFRRKGLLAQAS